MYALLAYRGSASCFFATVYNSLYRYCVCELVARLCQALWDPMDCSAPGSSVHGILQARILVWVASHSLLQGIFLTQGSKLGLLHCWQSLYHLSHQGRLKNKDTAQWLRVECECGFGEGGRLVI